MADGSLMVRGRRRRSSPALAQWPLDAGITVVLFAGLGGACDGLEEAGCPVTVANNHDDVALAAHAARHPHTRHVRGDIFDVDPIQATRGQRVRVLWASPDCRDHSVAKGGAPRSPRVRSLPWQVCRWAGVTRPELIMMENVREIRGWGPLVAKRDRATGRVLRADGSVAAPGERVPVREQQLVRDPRHLGRSFRAFIRHLRHLGYAYEDRDLCCADYGVPTTRRRWFAVARRDGLPIRWPERTHAPRSQAAALGLLPWVPAASIIDWSIPCPSIFERARPLAPATMRRIAAGLRRYVLESAEPFVIPITQAVPTLAAATLVQMGYGERDGQQPRTLDIKAPIGTQVQANKFALVSAWMVQHNLGVVGNDARDPCSTLLTAGTQTQVGVAYLAHLRGTSIALDATDPAPTLTTGGGHVAQVVAFLSQYYSEGSDSQACDEPLATVTTKARHAVVTVTIAGRPYAIVDIGMRMLTPEEAAAAHELRLPKTIVQDGQERRLTKTEAMRLIGNSVPKRMARLLAEANAAHALEGMIERTAA